MYKGAVPDNVLLTTVAVRDVCRMRGVPIDYPSIVAAETALLRGHHHYTGAWVDCHGLGEEYLTRLIVGYYQRREQRSAETSDAAMLGRGMVLKSHALSQSEAPTESILALISPYHGLEYTLYGFLLNHEVSIRICRGETIGCRDAIVAFEQLAKQVGWIQQKASLPYRRQLTELAAQRDAVIHRVGRGVSRRQVKLCRRGIQRHKQVQL